MVKLILIRIPDYCDEPTNQRVYCDEPTNVFIDVLRLFETVGYVSLKQICRTNMTVRAHLQVPNIDNPLHSNTLSRLRANQSLLVFP